MNSLTNNRPLWVTLAKRTLPIAYFLLLLWTGYVFFENRGGIDWLVGADFRALNLFLFPLLGLYAFFFVWAQIIVGTSLPVLRKIYGWSDRFHRAEGIFAVVFALLHPAMLLVGTGLSSYLAKDFVPATLRIFVWIGQIQLVLMLCAAGAALLRRVSWLQSRWRMIHYLNYLIFVLVWVHSWFLGSDVRSTALKYVWIFYGASAIVASVRKWRYRLSRRWPPVKEPNVQITT